MTVGPKELAQGRTLLDLGRTTAQGGQRACAAAYGAVWTTTHTYALSAPVLTVRAGAG
ncbi:MULTISPECIES: hypothetical protein [unclassified Streptomyces]|uniref:hypothetical protein n=1 Tax=unclassified Streptomyces TaxID=2593676 RepID=UPI000A5FF1FB|nr:MULTISPECIES: hypothetical protein [unclassified Streptomyces]